MAVYKVPQDVEAVDKLIGPFSFKQFIYLIITFLLGFITFRLFLITPALSIFTALPAIVFGILGGYQRKDQPIEAFLSALVKFVVLPRKRLWSQSGVAHDVIITAPKTKRPPIQRSPWEVKGQLKQLSQLMDTRGWSTKRAEIQLPGQVAVISHDERLVVPVEQPQEVLDIRPQDDVLDTENSYIGRSMGQLAQNSTQQARQHAISVMQQASDGNQPQGEPQQSQVENNVELPKDVHYDPYGPIHQAVVKPPSADILKLSENEQLNVGEIAHQAKRLNQQEEKGSG